MSVIEMMAAYARDFRLAPTGPHRALADRLFKGARQRCETCGGRPVYCHTCQNAGVVLVWSREEVDAVREQVLREYPEAAGPRPQTPRPQTAPKADADTFPRITDRDKLIGALIDEIRGPELNEALVSALGHNLLDDFGDSLCDGEAGILLRHEDYADLPDGSDPVSIDDLEDVGVLADHLPDSRYQQIENGARLTIDEFLLWRDLTVNQRFEDDGYHEAWQIMRIESRSGLSAFVAMTVTGGAREGTEREFVGVFGSLEAAQDAIRRLGYTSPEDLRHRLRSGASEPE